MSRTLRLILAVLPLALLAGAVTLATPPERGDARTAHEAQAYDLPEPPVEPYIAWRRSRPLGQPYWGRLVRGVKLPAEGPDWFTWDPVLRVSPDRWWRRFGTDKLVRTTLEVIREYRAAHPESPRIGIGDLSRPHGGSFGRQYGGLGHMSHQNGLDVDVYYPRRDGLERAPLRPGQVDRAAAQELVDRFVDAGAVRVFVGPSLRLRGPRRIVTPLVHHDDHLHVRIRPPFG